MHMSQCIRRLFSTTRNRRPLRVLPWAPPVPHKYAPRPPGKPIQPPSIQTQWTRYDHIREERDELYETISFLLRHKAGKDYGLPSRADGYLSAQKLLNYPMFRNMDIVQLQFLVDNDRKHRFEIKYDPGKPCGPWWVCAKSWQEDYYVLRPALLSSTNGMAIYTTNVHEWDAYISRTGIARLDQEFIRLLPYPRTNNYIDNFNDENQVFIYLDIETCIRAGLRFYYQARAARRCEYTTAPILTRGDRYGVISPTFFSHVRSIDAKKTHLWGPEVPYPIKPTPIDSTVMNSDGTRRTFLPILRRNPPGFFDLSNVGESKHRPAHPDTLKEAEEVVNFA